MDINDEPTPVADAEETVSTAIRNTDFTLCENTLTNGVLRFDIDCGGLPRIPDARDPVLKPKDSYENAGERAQQLSDIITKVKNDASIVDFEVWLAAEELFNGPTTSKFTQKPDLSEEDMGYVVLLVQPQL